MQLGIYFIAKPTISYAGELRKKRASLNLAVLNLNLCFALKPSFKMHDNLKLNKKYFKISRKNKILFNGSKF